MYILNTAKVQESLYHHGYHSITDLADDLGIHRNTIHHYLSGQPVLPEKLDKILEALRLEPAEAFIRKQEKLTCTAEPISFIVDALHERFPRITFVLFGSRVKGTAKKYSDWDLGAYAASGISHDEFIELQKARSDLEEKSPFMIQITNLNLADKEFLLGISRHMIFLTGRLADWIHLKKLSEAA